MHKAHIVHFRALANVPQTQKIGLRWPTRLVVLPFSANRSGRESKKHKKAYQQRLLQKKREKSPCTRSKCFPFTKWWMCILGRCSFGKFRLACSFFCKLLMLFHVPYIARLTSFRSNNMHKPSENWSLHGWGWCVQRGTPKCLHTGCNGKAFP